MGMGRGQQLKRHLTSWQLFSPKKYMYVDNPLIRVSLFLKWIRFENKNKNNASRSMTRFTVSHLVNNYSCANKIRDKSCLLKRKQIDLLAVPGPIIDGMSFLLHILLSSPILGFTARSSAFLSGSPTQERTQVTFTLNYQETTVQRQRSAKTCEYPTG